MVIIISRKLALLERDIDAGEDWVDASWTIICIQASHTENQSSDGESCDEIVLGKARLLVFQGDEGQRKESCGEEDCPECLPFLIFAIFVIVVSIGFDNVNPIGWHIAPTFLIFLDLLHVIFVNHSEVSE